MASTAASRISLSFIKLSCTTPGFLTLSWIRRSVLLMVRWIEPLAVPAERFMGAAAQDALGDYFNAAAVVVTLLGASGTHLRVLALESFVANLLAVVALLWSHPTFEDSRISGFSSGVEKAVVEEPPG